MPVKPPDLGRTGIWIRSTALIPGADGAQPEPAEIAGELEEAGYGAMWLGMADGDLALVSSLLAQTRRLVVATGIVSIWTNPAETTAAAYAAVSGRYPGRVLLGLGVSHSMVVERAGLQYARPYQKMVGYLDALDNAATPVPPQRRALAALGPRMLRLAAERSAGAHPYLVTPEHTRRARAVLGDGPLLAPEQKVVLETDPAAAREIGRNSVSFYLQAPNYTRNLLRLGFTEDDFTGGGSDRLIDAVVAWGDVASVLARIREHYDAGADHVAIQALTADGSLPRAQWRQLGEALHG
jgi:probable F420-dependent oxidoreductase